MKVLFTGGSSFTGMWFARTLAQAGHEVTATFQAARVEGYADPLRRERVQRTAELCTPVYSCSFGTPQFIELIRAAGSFDVLCHHAADVTDYKSPDFDVTRAVSRNTANARGVLAALRDTGCRRVVLSGSVFEGGEGAGSGGLPHFSPYGLSKALSAELFRFYAGEAGLCLGKFVIPNPFGPYEEPRFTAYLARSWYGGQTPVIKTPAYVRDNIHVELLAKAYERFASTLPEESAFLRSNPSGYVESQGAFARRFAREMRERLGLECPVEEAEQVDFSEPRIRLNTEPLDVDSLGWCERDAWDAVARYYSDRFGPARSVG